MSSKTTHKPSEVLVVALFSGGLDSTALLAYLLQLGHRPIALSIDYGQRHVRELDSARAIAKAMKVEHVEMRIDGFRAAVPGSSQTDASVDVPEGHYTEKSMRATVVPNRNMVFLALGASVALARGAGLIAYAAHSGDHAIYRDCREPFVRAMRKALACVGEPEGLDVFAPFLGMTKAQLVRLAFEEDAPLRLSWSCYNGRALHCGRCGTCVERREAFKLAGVEDPTVYEEDLRR